MYNLICHEKRVEILIIFSYITCIVNDIDQDSGIEMEDGEVADSSSKIGYYNATESSSVPKFTKYENMHRVIAKPAGNMLKLKCAAEGNYYYYCGIKLTAKRCFLYRVFIFCT